MQENISFIKLLKGKGYSIQIPVIQRDYAQGRKDSKTQEIRVNFPDELESALEPDGRPLVLDFVYGSLDNYIFIPLDGQQRLTTLFLLHWYLCPDDAQFKEFLQKGDNSKFTYETRTSSKEFCNGLVKNHLSSIKREGFNTLSGAIKDASRFMWVWHKDPTIIGMLVMLDAIDAKLNGKNHLYKLDICYTDEEYLLYLKYSDNRKTDEQQLLQAINQNAQLEMEEKDCQLCANGGRTISEVKGKILDICEKLKKENRKNIFAIAYILHLDKD